MPPRLIAFSPTWLVAVLAVAALAGCASGPVQIYDAARDKQGQALAASWKTVDIAGYFAALRAQRAQLLQQEIDEAGNAAIADRDSLARLILDHPLVATDRTKRATGLDSLLQARWKTLTGAAGFPASGERDALDTIADATNAIDVMQADLDVSFAAIFVATRQRLTCDSAPDAMQQALLAATAPAGNAVAAAAIRALPRECARLAQARARRDAAYPAIHGAIGDVAALRESETQALARRRDEADRQSAVLQAATADAQAAAPAGAASSAERLAAAAAKAQKAVQVLQSAQDAFSDKALAKARLAELSALLQALQDGQAPDGAAKGVVAAAALPRLADDLDALRGATSMRPMTALLLRVQLETVRLNNAQARIDLSQRRLHRYGELLATMASEARRLRVAHEAIAADLGNTTPVARLLEAAADGRDPAHPRPAPPSSGIATDASVASLVLLDTTTNERLAAERQTLQLASLADEEAMTASEMNADLHAALIDAVVQQTSAYAAVGIKGSDLTNIVSAVSLLWIGRGVNK